MINVSFSTCVKKYFMDGQIHLNSRVVHLVDKDSNFRYLIQFEKTVKKNLKFFNLIQISYFLTTTT
jgi:hypothetical protein